MSTFNARSATEALFPWSLIWISEDTAANSSKIVRLNALNSFLTSIDWNCQKACNRSSCGSKTDCDSVYQDYNSVSCIFWYEDLTRQTENVRVKGYRG